DDALLPLAAAEDVAGNPVGAATDILEGEFVGDAGAPAIGPEDDLGRWRGRRHEVSSQSLMRRTRLSTRCRSAAAPLSKATGVEARIPRGTSDTVSRRSTRSTTRSSGPASASWSGRRARAGTVWAVSAASTR